MNWTVEPEARNRYSCCLDLPETSPERVSNTADSIWEATKRCHTSWYMRNWSRLRNSLIESGWRMTAVGRMASWASWAPLDLVRYLGGSGGRNLSPYPSA